MKANTCSLYIVRHGQSEGNVMFEKNQTYMISTSLLGTPLTKKGKEQAKILGKKFSDIPFAAIFSSDYLRAKQTAEIISLEKKLMVQTTHLIRERLWGRFSEQNTDGLREKMKQELEMLTSDEKMHYTPDSDVESMAQAATRLLTFLREIAVAYSGKSVLIVCHATIMKAVLVHLGIYSFEELPHASIENTGYFVLETDGTDFTLRETQGIYPQKS